jgi:predicted 3-demethylubiquinone-9 3-methyltransferase (glyoxalase superfamily)
MATPKNTICLWYDHDAEEAARFYAGIFPDSAVGAVHCAPSDYPSGKAGDVLMVEFTVAACPVSASTGGRSSSTTKPFRSRSRPTTRQRPTAIGTRSSAMAARRARAGGARTNGVCRGITPRVLTDAMAKGGDVAKRAFEAMMPMKKIEVAKIEAARRGEASNA